MLAIETLSRNDEEATIGARIGRYIRVSTALLPSIRASPAMATRRHTSTLERAVKTVRDTAGSAESEYKQQIADLTAEKQRLEKIVNEGSHDSELSKQLSSVRAELDATKDQYNRVRADMDKAKAAHAKRAAQRAYRLRSGRRYGFGQAQRRPPGGCSYACRAAGCIAPEKL